MRRARRRRRPERVTADAGRPRAASRTGLKTFPRGRAAWCGRGRWLRPARARSVYIVLGPGCLGFPYTTVHVVQTKTAITLKVFGWLQQKGSLGTCSSGGGSGARLRAPIDGREIKGESWPTRLRFGSLADERPVGLPRLLGLSPRQAVRTLWFYGFRSKLFGKGGEVVAQLPGWGMAGKGTNQPDPYSGVTKLRAGSRIEIPIKPRVRPGAPTGLLIGAIRGESYGSGPAPISGTVALFGASGRLLARFYVRPGHRFRIHLAAGHYQLLADSEGWIFCGATRALVHAHQITHVAVLSGCGGP